MASLYTPILRNKITHKHDKYNELLRKGGNLFLLS